MPKVSVFPSSLVQELRSLVPVISREACMTGKASGETTQGQQLLQEQDFHGSSNYASALTNIMEGKGYAACMFNRLPIDNNREGNEHRTESHMLQLLDMFTCDEGNVHFSFPSCIFFSAILFVILITR